LASSETSFIAVDNYNWTATQNPISSSELDEGIMQKMGEMDVDIDAEDYGGSRSDAYSNVGEIDFGFCIPSLIIRIVIYYKYIVLYLYIFAEYVPYLKTMLQLLYVDIL